jgi:hypothetical protein
MSAIRDARAVSMMAISGKWMRELMARTHAETAATTPLPDLSRPAIVTGVQGGDLQSQTIG